jgi:cysteine sulfinate desulfinase/cysteine desulfurase-like protein
MEHPAMLEPLRALAKEGFGLIEAKPDNLGRIGPDELARVWRPEVSLVVVMAANNETGVLYPVKEMAAFAHARGALLFSDMVQALGKIPVNLIELGVDYASFSAHKIHGPKGVGALYVREGAPFAPFLVGGSQEDGRRAGTEAVHNLAGFAAAARQVPDLLSRAEGLRALKEAFIDGVVDFFPEVRLNSPRGNEAQPGTVSLCFPGRDNAYLLGRLDYLGISAAAGSACRTGANEPSHVLLAMGLSPEEARSTLRLSFGSSFSKKDLASVLKAFRITLGDEPDRDILVLGPSDITEDLIFRKDLSIIHVKRFSGLKGLPPLPGSRVMALSDHGGWEALTLSGPTLLTCEVGYDAPIMAWSLRRRGQKRLSVLALGLWGLKLRRPDFWARLASMDPEGGNDNEPS